MKNLEVARSESRLDLSFFAPSHLLACVGSGVRTWRAETVTAQPARAGHAFGCAREDRARNRRR
jgi:hypothetical protein